MSNKVMANAEQTILLVSDDAALCAAARREFEAGITGLHVAAVSNVEAARIIMREDTPAVIVFEETSVAAAAAAAGTQEPAQRLDNIVTSLTVHAPVVVIGAEERRTGLSELIASGAADFVVRDGSCLPETLSVIQRRLHSARRVRELSPHPFPATEGDFGEVLRHELNNPLTGILGNAELLLAEIRRKDDGKLPHGGRQRVETIAALAVRLRETVRRLSQEWEERRHLAH